VLLRELHERDVIRLDPHGGIRCAYPFSATPTAHLVDIEGGPSVYAMCAIDALGMSAMLHRDVTIRSTDPRNGRPITVTVHNGHARWTPGSVVVVDGAITTSPGGDCCPPDTPPDALVQAAADRCCGVLNFFTEFVKKAKA
jgi:Alkylmercury lyase